MEMILPRKEVSTEPGAIQATPVSSLWILPVNCWWFFLEFRGPAGRRWSIDEQVWPKKPGSQQLGTRPHYGPKAPRLEILNGGG
jgi:hypothetical protein